MTETRIIAGGVFTPNLALISADQDTILGDGTPVNPLHLSAGGSAVLVGTLQDASDVDIGTTVRLLTSGDTFGKASTSEQLKPAQAVGIVTAFDSGTEEVSVTISGEVTLTTTQWDAWTGQSGGLTPGSIYYVGTFPDEGTITTIAPSISGQFIAQVGIARSSTVMLLSTPCFPLVVP